MNKYSYNKEQIMFWNNVAGIYETFEMTLNKKATLGASDYVGELIEKEDEVLECACGTGIFSRKIAPRCKRLTATDLAPRMLDKARDNCKSFDNIIFEEAYIMDLKYEDNSFDKVVAANVIHLVSDSSKAIAEFKRVLKPGGLLIIPTYVQKKSSGKLVITILNKLGADFKETLTADTYEDFIKSKGFTDFDIRTIDGPMPCAVAKIRPK